MVAQRLRDYEIVLILTPEANEGEVEAVVERLNAFITDRGGNVNERDTWGLRRLAYPIRDFMEGIYIVIKFTLDAKDVLDMDRSLNTSEEVIRHLVTKI